MLAHDVPAIISFTVPAIGLSGDLVAANNGIVTDIGGFIGGTGGHVMLLIGFVPNAELPHGTPPSPGVGYLFLPDPWVAQWARDCLRCLVSVDV